MSKETENYGYVLPAQEDFADIDVINDNMISIDADMKAVSDAIGNAAQGAQVEEVKTGLTGIAQKIGATADSGGSNTLGTMFAKLNFLVTQFLSFWTQGRAAKLDHMDVNVSTRADGSVWTAGRAAKLDLVDANVSTRAPANTAISNGVWTDGRAANLDRIQAVLNTPNGDSLGAWINSISTNVNTTAARTLQDGQSAAYWAKVSFDHAAAANTNASAAISKAEEARVAAVTANSMAGAAKDTAALMQTEGNAAARYNALYANTATNNAANRNGLLSAKHAYTHEMLENWYFGLNAIRVTLDTAVNAINYTNAVGSIKCVQRGSLHGFLTSTGVEDGYSYIDVVINAVNMNKSFITIYSSGNGSGSSTTNGRLVAVNLLRLYSTRAGNNDIYQKLSWEVIEFY